MSYTKRKIINQAMTEIGLGSFNLDAQPEDLQDALFKLNAMLAEWTIYGAVTGALTPFVDDLDADSLIPMTDILAVVSGLAVILAPSFGKQVSPATTMSAFNGRRAIVKRNFTVVGKRSDVAAIPAGAGHKYDRRINLESDPAV
mgnify:CR=1 FL=1|tara:strand:- start:1029 stop:1460 length:432 start_codon:yes stop_codon:yes gene_type:complete